MPDWVYELVKGVVTFMDRITLGDVMILAAASPIVVPFVVLIHEAGHAIAAVGLRRRVADLTVGNEEPVLTMRIGGFRLRLGAIAGHGDVAGFVRYDGFGASARETFIIALAGPLASLLGAVACGAAAVRSLPHVGVSQLFAFASIGGLMCCIGNLRVSGSSPASWSDGAWMRAAWRAMHRPTPPTRPNLRPDANQGTPTPPPRRRSAA